jgi:hypothetical protein
MPNAIPDDILNNKELNEAIKGESAMEDDGTFTSS